VQVLPTLNKIGNFLELFADFCDSVVSLPLAIIIIKPSFRHTKKRLNEFYLHNNSIFLSWM
jgi:hypothetical protein